VGGGSLSRELITTAKAMDLDEAAQDAVAISVSRLTAQLMLLKLDRESALSVPVTVEDAAKRVEKDGIVVMGGLKPGMTTDTVAALVAERIHADLLVKATDVDGVFDKDPKKYRDAKKFAELRYDELSKIFEKKRHEAGIHQVIDPEAIRILRRAKVRTVVVNGFKPENVFAAIKGREIGTVISG
jgi:uridylate kinase